MKEFDCIGCVGSAKRNKNTQINTKQPPQTWLLEFMPWPIQIMYASWHVSNLLQRQRDDGEKGKETQRKTKQPPERGTTPPTWLLEFMPRPIQTIHVGHHFELAMAWASLASLASLGAARSATASCIVFALGQAMIRERAPCSPRFARRLTVA